MYIGGSSMEKYSLLVLTKEQFKDELFDANVKELYMKEQLGEEIEPLSKRLKISFEDVIHLANGEFHLMENDIKALKTFNESLEYPLGYSPNFEQYKVNVPSPKKINSDCLMQIDDYTTEFIDREDLLSDIRKNNYITIDPEIPNTDLLIFIAKQNSNEQLPILNFNHYGLKLFITSHQYDDEFKKDKSIKEINNKLLSLLKSKDFYPEVSLEMHDFFTTYKGYFSDKLLSFRNWDLELERIGLTDKKIFMTPLTEYKNIRAYFILLEEYKRQQYTYYEKYRSKTEPLDSEDSDKIRELINQMDVKHTTNSHPKERPRYISNLKIYNVPSDKKMSRFEGSLFEEEKPKTKAKK